MPNPCRQRSFWARIKLSKQKNVKQLSLLIYLVQKSLTCFSIVVFLTKFFASSHYFDLSIETRFINGLIALFKFSRNTQRRKILPDVLPCRELHRILIRQILYTFCFIYVIRSTDSIWNASASSRGICFFLFEWSPCFILHDHLIYHTFSHCQVDFWIFSKFFSTYFIRQDFLSKSIMFFAWSFTISRFLHLSNALLRIFQTFFWKTFRRTPCFPAKALKNIVAVQVHHRHCMLFRFHHSL